MAKVNVPMFSVMPGGWDTAYNTSSSTAIAANLCLVPDTTADRAAAVPATSAVVTAFAGVTPVKIPAATTGDVSVRNGDVAVCTASGTVAVGDRVYIDTATGKEGYVKTYGGFSTSGKRLIVGTARTGAADGELLEVLIATFLAGDGFQAGTATLSSGTITVSGVTISTSARIVATAKTPGGTQGILSVPSANRSTAGTFVVNSSTNADTSTIDWLVIDN